MDIASTIVAAGQTFIPRRPDRPSVLLGYMLGWLLAATAATAFICAAVALNYKVSGQAPPDAVMPLAGAICFQAALIPIALHRAKIVGWRSDRADGLGLAPIRRWWLFCVFVAAILLMSTVFWAIRVPSRPTWLPAPQVGAVETIFADSGPVTMIVWIVWMTLLAPIAEEMFFRGWLWTGLRRFRTPLPVMIVTSIPWLAIHGYDARFMALITVILCLARHYCGSVRATLALHAINNSGATVAMLAIYGFHR
jgi:uncharacterized protein